MLDSKKYQGSLDSLGSAHLTIHKIQPVDATNYTCEVEWNGNPLSVTHTLTVLQVMMIMTAAAVSVLVRM